jgi:ribosomal protein S11
MGVRAMVSNIFGTGSKDAVPLSVATESDFAQHQAREAEIKRDLQELNTRIRHIQSTVLEPLSVAKQQLAGVKAKRLQTGAAAFIDGRQQDLKAIDADIAQREAVIAALEKDADIATAALAQLNERVSEIHREVAAIKQDGLRVRVRQLEIALREYAPTFQAQAEAFKDAIVELSAMAMARDFIGPQVAGNTQIGSVGIAQIEINTPQLPAFEKIGGRFNLHAAAEARMRVILQELGVRV